MSAHLQMAEFDVEIVRKDIKNVHRGVLPPHGAVRISAPERLTDKVLKSFVLSKLGWIREQQAAMNDQSREPRREFLRLESHHVWGDRYLLEIEPESARHEIILRPGTLTVRLWGEYSEDKCARVIGDWYRAIVRERAISLLTVWENRIGVSANRLFIQRMKTRWGGCNPATGNIRLNSELGKKPVECLEYILVHELIHLLEPTHSERFHALLRQHMPTWQARRKLLNSLPLSHDDWAY
jgi:predicted metal-dependent hydrolase